MVVSILFTINDANGDTDFFGVNASPSSFNLKNLFDCISDRFFYRYKGQLTEGSCEDPVEWAVAREPIAISQASYDALKSAADLAINAQATQAVGSRTIRLAGSPCHPSIDA